MQLTDYLKDYLSYLEIECNRSLATVTNYHRYIKRFLTWSTITTPAEITYERMQDYRLHLNRITLPNGDNLSKSTQNYHIIALRAFLKYLAMRDIPSLSADKITVGSNPSRDIEFLSLDEVAELITAISGTDIKSRRDRAIIELLFSTGLRVSELINLDREHINFDKCAFSVRGKGDKRRMVFVAPAAAAIVAQYVNARTDIDPALFVRHGTGRTTHPTADSLRLTPRTIQRIVKHYATKAGIIKNVHPHTLRHSFATDLFTNGADIRSVQELLGHASITTTQIYTHITNTQLHDIHRKFHAKSIHNGDNST